MRVIDSVGVAAPESVALPDAVVLWLAEAEDEPVAVGEVVPVADMLWLKVCEAVLVCVLTAEDVPVSEGDSVWVAVWDDEAA